MGEALCLVVPVGKGKSERYHAFVKQIISSIFPEKKFVRVRYQPGDDGEMQSWAFLDVANAPSPVNGAMGDEMLPAGTLTVDGFMWDKTFSHPCNEITAMFHLYERIKTDHVEIFQELNELHLRVIKADMRTPAELQVKAWPIFAPMLEDDQARETFERLLTQALQEKITVLPIGRDQGLPRRLAIWPARIAVEEFPAVVMRGYVDKPGEGWIPGEDFWCRLLHVQARREKRQLDTINGLLALLRGGVA